MTEPTSPTPQSESTSASDFPTPDTQVLPTDATDAAQGDEQGSDPQVAGGRKIARPRLWTYPWAQRSAAGRGSATASDGAASAASPRRPWFKRGLLIGAAAALALSSFGLGWGAHALQMHGGEHSHEQAEFAPPGRGQDGSGSGSPGGPGGPGGRGGQGAPGGGAGGPGGAGRTTPNGDAPGDSTDSQQDQQGSGDSSGSQGPGVLQQTPGATETPTTSPTGAATPASTSSTQRASVPAT